MSKSQKDQKLQAPTGTTLWCCPLLKDVCSMCSGCYNCCDSCKCCPTCCRCSAPCPLCYYCLPCCCCCCRPGQTGQKQEDEIVVVAETETTIEEGEHFEGPEPGEEQPEECEVEEAPEAEAKEASPPAGDVKGQPTVRKIIKHPKAKPAAKRSPRSQPKVFTGKAGALPPPPGSACVGPPPSVEAPVSPVGKGAYLVYSDEEGGRLKEVWSKEPLTGPGVLAHLKPAKDVSDFRFDKKKCTEILASNLQICMQSEFPADRAKFYEGWSKFIKLLNAWGGEIVMMPAAAAEPPPRVKLVHFNGGKPQEIKAGDSFSSSSLDILAVAPSNATKFEVERISQGDFTALANAVGVCISFKK